MTTTIPATEIASTDITSIRSTPEASSTMTTNIPAAEIATLDITTSTPTPETQPPTMTKNIPATEIAPPAMSETEQQLEDLQNAVRHEWHQDRSEYIHRLEVFTGRKINDNYADGMLHALKTAGQKGILLSSLRAVFPDAKEFKEAKDRLMNTPEVTSNSQKPARLFYQAKPVTAA